MPDSKLLYKEYDNANNILDPYLLRTKSRRVMFYLLFAMGCLLKQCGFNCTDK